MTSSCGRRTTDAPAWQIASARVKAAVLSEGGHLGSADFQLAGGRQVSPLHVAPWLGERLPDDLPTMLRNLRGDFFCMPFGGNDAPYRGERHPPHGQTANDAWTLVDSRDSGDLRELELRLQTSVRPAEVTKIIRLRDSHTAIYQRHVIRGGSGFMSFGHHAMLRFSGERGGLISTSPIRSGWTTPKPFEEPAAGGYSLLKPAERFRSLSRVPTITGEPADLTFYPARRGFEDLVMLVNRPAELGWTAVVFPTQRYAWFALKDPRVLPQTVLWMSNGGRHYPPWNGRHVGVMGLEEVCSYFHYGLAESVKAKQIDGTPTVARLSPRRPTTINYIMAVCAVPQAFEHVRSIRPGRDGRVVTLTDEGGRRVDVGLDVGFLYAR